MSETREPNLDLPNLDLPSHWASYPCYKYNCPCLAPTATTRESK